MGTPFFPPLLLMHPAFAETDHRPWPLLSRPWAWTQAWLDLCFVHWEVDPDELQRLLPAGLELDLYDDKAWIGIVPFDMEGVMRRPFPAISWLSDFPEINVRTYVRHGGKHGVWFFSLDVPNRLAVWVARAFYHLPYRYARIGMKRDLNEVAYKVRGRESRFDAIYRPGEDIHPTFDSFDAWCTERYCLYSADRQGNLYRGEIHHRQWPLQRAEIEIRENNLTNFIAVGDQHPSVLYCPEIDVVIWPLEPVEPLDEGS